MSGLSTLQKKQIVAVTGIGLIGFVFAHLSGNFLIFKGADALNDYAQFLHDLGAVLWAMRIGLILMFLLHMGFTASLVIGKIKARGSRYASLDDHAENTSLAAKLMPYTGVVILVYLIFHLLDFTLTEKVGFVNGEDLGLYGLVVSSFMDPVHSGLYIVAMVFLGLHLVHSIQSVFQTFGIANSKNLAVFRKISLFIGMGVAFAYSSIPLYVLLTF